MDIPLHLGFWVQGIDPIVWMRVVRVLFFAVCGILMLREPMMCGGRNQVFHRMLAFVFFVWAFYSWDTAMNRMDAIALRGIAATTSTLLFSEIIMTIAAISVVCKLGYDYVQWKEYTRVRLESSCGSCKVQFGP